MAEANYHLGCCGCRILLTTIIDHLFTGPYNNRRSGTRLQFIDQFDNHFISCMCELEVDIVNYELTLLDLPRSCTNIHWRLLRFRWSSTSLHDLFCTVHRSKPWT